MDAHRGTPPQVDLGITPLPEMTRPVYPYPFTARHSGSGSLYDSSQWEKGEPMNHVDTRAWPEADLFGAYDFTAK